MKLITKEEAILYMELYKLKLVNSISDGLDKDIEAYNMAIKALKKEPEWIPISERLPKEKDGSVFVTMPDKKVMTARYSEFSDTWYVGDMMGVGGPEPIAWMPLPISYKEREDK